MSESELRVKCSALATAGDAVAAAVLRLLDELDKWGNAGRFALARIRRLEGELAAALVERDLARKAAAAIADRCHKQSELLSKKAERKDGDT